jgi:IS4 transposase
MLGRSEIVKDDGKKHEARYHGFLVESPKDVKLHEVAGQTK